MNKWSFFFLGTFFVLSGGREPFKAPRGALPFLVYYPSRYRGICVGTLLSRMVVITAAACVTNPKSERPDTRPINVITGTSYRHPRRGIRVQVTKILIPRIHKGDKVPHRAYLLQKSVAVLLLKKQIPDVLVETPLRALDVDWKGEESLALQEECLIVGWHFFYKGDKIYPVHKFLLQRNVRIQFVNIVKMQMYCDPLLIKYQASLANYGYDGYFSKDSQICIRDGMYGAPLLCRGRAVAIMLAPDAQWTNCTGFSNILHLFSSDYLRNFMECISVLISSETRLNWESIKALYDDSGNDFDYLPALYDRILDASGSSSDEQ